MSTERTQAFRRNPRLEEALRELNGNLEAAELALYAALATKEMPAPLVLVVSPPRSGSTLLMQWLASTGLVAVPTNLMSRFYGAPVIGAKIQRILTDSALAFRDELAGLVAKPHFQSDNGKTSGVLSPNEFWYFWRRLVTGDPDCCWTDDYLARNMDAAAARAAIIGIMEVFGAAFACKGMIFNFALAQVSSIFEKLLIIRLTRDPVDTVESILRARITQFGVESAWYSFATPNRDDLLRLPELEQVAGQVSCIDTGIDRGLGSIDPDDIVEIRYESFCESPERVYADLACKLGTDAADYRGCKRFVRNESVSGSRRLLIERALAKFSS